MYTLSEILKGQPNDIDNDINIIRSSIQYKAKTKDMEYMLYELEMTDTTGRKVHLFKAVKFYRLIKLPDAIKQSTKMMDIHSQLLSSFYESNIKFISILARIEETGDDSPIGLLQLYGVQGIGRTIEDAKRIADQDFAGLTSALQGNYRTIEFRFLNTKEAEWLKEKMAHMKQIQVVRGIPTARKSAADRSAKGFGGQDLDCGSEETSEQFAAGLANHEFIAMTLSSPIQYEILENWLTKTSKKQTYWNSIMQGSTSLSAGINIPVMFSANLGASSGMSDGVSDSTSEGTSTSHSVSHGTSFSTSESVSSSSSFSESVGSSSNVGTSEGVGSSQGISQGQSYGASENVGLSHGISSSLGESYSISNGHSEGTSYGESSSNGHSTGTSQTVGESFGFSESHSNSQSVTNSTGVSNSQSESFGTSQSVGQSSSVSHSQSSSLSAGQSWGGSASNSFGVSSGGSHSSGTSANVSGNVSLFGVAGAGVSGGSSQSDTISAGTSQSASLSSNWGGSASASNSTGVSSSNGVSTSSGTSHGTSFGTTTSNSQSIGNSVSNGTSVSHGTSTSQGVSESFSSSSGQSWGTSASNSVSASNGISASNGSSDGVSYGTGKSYGENVGASQSVSGSQGLSRGYGVSSSQSASVSNSHSQGVSNGTSSSESSGTGTSWGRSQGTSSSVSNSTSSGMGSSMGIGASLSVGKTYQFLDAEVQNIVELLEFQKNRLKSSINGKLGAFFVDMYIATENETAKAAARTAAKSAWGNESAMICPLQVLEPDEDESAHLLYHMNAFSPCAKKERDRTGELEGYKYTTILTSSELTAYTHVIRLSDGGLYADAQNIPELSVPSEMSGEVYIGKVVSGYRWTIESGYKTPFDYRIANDNIMHGLFAAGSRSGKTVAALRFVAELANHVRRKPYGKRMRIIAMDPKEDWRKLARYVEPERFRLYSMGDPNFCPFKLNPLKVPYGVDAEFHLDTLIDVFCRSYGLGVRSVIILQDTLKTLYDKEGIFDTTDPKEISEKSSRVTLANAFDYLNTKKMNGEFGRDKSDAVDKVLDRLSRYAWKNGALYKLYCQPDGMSIDELLGKDDVVVLESGKIQSNNMAFIFGFITASIYMYAKYHPDNFLHKDQYETCLVIEEANRVLSGEGGGTESGIQGQSIFEEMLDQAAGLGLFVFSITQKPSMMPSSILANSGLIWAGRMSIADDIDVMMSILGKEGRLDDRPIKKFFPLTPTGWFICKQSRTFDYKDSLPVMVAVDALDVSKPSNEDIKEMMLMNSIKNQQREIQSSLNEFNQQNINTQNFNNMNNGFNNQNFNQY